LTRQHGWSSGSGFLGNQDRCQGRLGNRSSNSRYNDRSRRQIRCTRGQGQLGVIGSGLVEQGIVARFHLNVKLSLSTYVQANGRQWGYRGCCAMLSELRSSWEWGIIVKEVAKVLMPILCSFHYPEDHHHIRDGVSLLEY